MKDPRDVLESRLEELITREARLQDHLRNTDRSPATFEDWMGVIENDEVVERLDESTYAEARKVIQALGRIENGVYGDCINCGDTIDEQRLQALPSAALCLDCATDEEKVRLR